MLSVLASDEPLLTPIPARFSMFPSLPPDLGDVQEGTGLLLDRRGGRSLPRPLPLELPHRRRAPLHNPCPGCCIEAAASQHPGGFCSSLLLPPPRLRIAWHRSPSSSCIAEFVATFLFLYITILTVMGVSKSNSKCSTVGIQGIAWAFGGMIFALVSLLLLLVFTPLVSTLLEALELPSSTTSTMPGVTIGSSGLVPSLELDVLVHCVLSPHMRPSFHPEGVYDESKVAKPRTLTSKEKITQLVACQWEMPRKHNTNQENQHAIAYVEGDKYYGAKATINVWDPKIQQPNEFSLSQLWILGGSFGEDLNSIEAGWQVV
ncbi:hypothetical protein J5N97_015871 [Dioscorea zingiberensis]|uniref:Neprosin PEP catalytic domain-containing protein n=1 Tax=Dioscorea zingiberensis TaxID=325984 RepID=A0A9D5HEN2_9LILI|nr:hypothetical protein J5N97_015871 [Dioscorea zingiberensis]